MDMVPVKSSNILEVGHDPVSGDMHVQFHRNGTPTAKYCLRKVTPEAHAGLMAAESPGKHFHAHFKDVYDSERIG